MNPIDLIRLQITLEYDLDKAGRLVPFPGSTEQGLYIVYRYPGGYIPYFNQCLPEALCERLRNLGGEQAFEAPQAVVWLMQRYLPCHYEGRFVSEYLPRLSEPREFLQVVKQDEQFVVLDGDKPVCRAWSERSNAQCVEVAVETHADHRRKGFARQAVTAWAHSVISSGRVALYSYKTENHPSQALAHSLGAVWYAEVVCFG
jgi:hypothetical protein